MRLIVRHFAFIYTLPTCLVGNPQMNFFLVEFDILSWTKNFDFCLNKVIFRLRWFRNIVPAALKDHQQN